MMFSLYNFMMVILFVYFTLFLHSFALFFEDFFLIIAFLLFLFVIFQLISTTAASYFAERAEHIRVLYSKLFTRRKEAIVKNQALIKQMYLDQDPDLVSQYAALFYLKHQFNVKVNKEIEIKVQETGVQETFIEQHQNLINEIRGLVDIQAKHIQRHRLSGIDDVIKYTLTYENSVPIHTHLEAEIKYPPTDDDPEGGSVFVEIDRPRKVKPETSAKKAVEKKKNKAKAKTKKR